MVEDIKARHIRHVEEGVAAENFLVAREGRGAMQVLSGLRRRFRGRHQSIAHREHKLDHLATGSVVVRQGKFDSPVEPDRRGDCGCDVG